MVSCDRSTTGDGIEYPEPVAGTHLKLAREERTVESIVASSKEQVAALFLDCFLSKDSLICTV
jgi:hypothetical protein